MIPQPPAPAPASRRRQRSKAAARLTGRADDETEDNAASPFDTAEIPVPHSREYERAEDAPAIRALLAKKRARAGIACIVSGAMSLVMIVLALLPVRPAALNDPMVYPAALLVLLLVSCAVNWRAFLDGFRGLGKTLAGQPFDFTGAGCCGAVPGRSGHRRLHRRHADAGRSGSADALHERGGPRPERGHGLRCL